MNIVGTWNYKLDSPFGQMDITYYFRVDGTYTYFNAVTGQRTDGEYEISGNRMNFPNLGKTINFTLSGDNLSLDYGSSSGPQNLKRV